MPDDTALETMRAAAALDTMRAAAAMWSLTGGGNATELIDAACGLLVAGHSGDDLAILAGVMSVHAAEEVPPLVEPALRDVGLVPYEPGAAGRLLAASRPEWRAAPGSRGRA